MKKIVFGICAMVLIASCSGGGKKEAATETGFMEEDSLGLPSSAEVQDTSWVIEDVIPATADESFADFFYNFASDADFQRTRIVFPISMYKGTGVVRVSQKDWTYDPLFSREQAYTVLFDHVEDMEMEKDTAVHSVQVDEMDLTKRLVKRYYFERIKNVWFLEAINQEKLAEEQGREDFYTFYRQFSCDSAFQLKRLDDPLVFVTVDPEDEFQILETTLDVGQWFSFRPPLMKEKLTNVHYGQSDKMNSDTKIVEFKGFGNGFSNTLYFQRRNGTWKLNKFEDLSD